LINHKDPADTPRFVRSLPLNKITHNRYHGLGPHGESIRVRDIRSSDWKGRALA